MKLIYVIAGIVLFYVSCNSFFKERPYEIVNKYSKLNFNAGNIISIKIDDNTSGIKDEGVLQGIFKMVNVNLDSLQRQLINMGYKKLPINELQMGDGFNGNVKYSDLGYYSLTLLNKSIIDELIIFNFTQNRVIIYKLKS
jgi:hypothetical protein